MSCLWKLDKVNNSVRIILQVSGSTWDGSIIWHQGVLSPKFHWWKLWSSEHHNF